MGKLVLSIEVDIDQSYQVNGGNGSATMILFNGKSDCENFKGKV